MQIYMLHASSVFADRRVIFFEFLCSWLHSFISISHAWLNQRIDFDYNYFIIIILKGVATYSLCWHIQTMQSTNKPTLLLRSSLIRSFSSCVDATRCFGRTGNEFDAMHSIRMRKYRFGSQIELLLVVALIQISKSNLKWLILVFFHVW